MDIKLLEPKDLKKYFESTNDWKAFWHSLEELFYKNYWENWDWDKEYFTPIIFIINSNWNKNYAWKLIKLWIWIEVDMYTGLEEAEDIILLFSYLIKNYLRDEYKLWTNLNLKEIALSISDKKFIEWERVRQILKKLIESLNILLDKHKYNEK
jgi:hypothetical protein